MPRWLDYVRWTVLGVLAAFIVVLLASARLITDWLWFSQLGYGTLWVRPILWRLGVGGVSGLFVALFLAVNLWLTGGRLRQALLHLQERVPQWGGMLWLNRAIVVISIAGGLISGSYFAGHWPTVAQGVTGGAFGAADPLHGADIGFYLFKLPLYELVLPFALVLTLLTALVTAAIYALSGSVSLQRRAIDLETRAKRHLAALIALAALLFAAGCRLAAYRLVYSTRGILYGAGYTDVHVTLPALWAMTGLSALIAALVVIHAFRPIRRWITSAVTVLVAGGILGTGIVPGLVQEFVVGPNELEKELPYIADHIAMTRLAYGLAHLQQRDYDPEGTLTPELVRAHAQTLANIRLWDYRPLLATYSQLQELRPYYDFIEVDVDRYTVGDEYRQVMIAARELTSASLQNRSWVNLHLQYTHGYGVVISPVNEVDARGLPRFWVSDIPPQGLEDLRVLRPQIYYGEQEADYVIVRTRRPEFDYPLGDDNATTFYQGSGGVPVGGWLRRVLFAVRLGTTRLLFSNDITPESRIMLYRPIMTRLTKLAPFLRFDRDPYLVLSEGRLFWIADAYTSSSRFPYAAPTPGWGNYVRNSVKAVIDAYNGSVDFYVVDEEPVIAALSRIYPGVFKPISAMPEDLRRHLRYPEELFRLQAQVLTRYHMTNPQVFYNQEDVWELPKEVYERSEVEMEPYYVITRLPGEEREEFILMLPFTPLGKGNMVAWLAARNDGDSYGELVLYRFGKQDVTFGPLQFEARVNQDTEISRELTLWSQQGSRVIRGNLIIVPIADTLLYVEPLFLQAEQGEIPELKRVIVGTGHDLVMRPTFWEALSALVGEDVQERPAPREVVQPEAAPRPVDQDNLEPDKDLANLSSLVERAVFFFDEAQRAAGRGDWSAYGQALDRLGDVLLQLRDLHQESM